MQRLLLVGLNHTTAPLEVREKVAFTGEQKRIALDAFRARFTDAEAVLLSTCNRVELYVSRSVHDHPREEEMIDFIAGCHDLPVADIAGYLYRRQDREAVTHLFSVASSLDSLVLGETQILGQVREAYDLARQAGSAGPMLHPLFQRALAVGKQVMSDTPLAEGHLSVASVAVDYARRIFDHFGDKTVLSIGAGEMATLVIQSFSALRPKKLLVCNRDAAKAVALAEQFAGAPAPFDQLADHLVAADVVISSTGSHQPIITKAHFAQLLHRRRYRPAFLIDIALPRDVEATVGDLENVYLYNIDDLQHVVAQTAEQRRGAVESARTIVLAQVEEFAAWDRGRRMGPMIDRLYGRSHEIARQEVERTLNKLGAALSQSEREQVEELARRIVNKLLHEPIQNLRDGEGAHGPAMHYLHALEKLFGLGAAQEQQGPKDEADPAKE